MEKLIAKSGPGHRGLKRPGESWVLLFGEITGTGRGGLSRFVFPGEVRDGTRGDDA